MPPRTRSGRAEKLEAQELLKSGRANIAGLVAVPAELLVNIISHLSCIPVPWTGWFHSHFPSQYLERRETLQALSQTCRRLRSVVLPILWEKIEVAVRKHDGKDRGFEKRLATELVRQLEIVTVRDPTFAPYVREVSVCLSDYSQATIFPELVRALHMFPNMCTLQIFGSAYHIFTEIKKAFFNHTFPGVKLLTTKQPIYNPFESFPQVKSYYTCNYPSAVFPHWDMITKHWKAVTEIHGLAVPAGRTLTTLASIVTGLPNISYLEVEAESILIPNGFLDTVPLFQQLKNLKVVKLIVYQYATGEQCATAKANIAFMLTRLRSTSQKRHHIIIEYRQGANRIKRAIEKRFELNEADVVISGDQSY